MLKNVSKYTNSNMKPLPLRENASELLKCSVRRNKMSPHASTILPSSLSTIHCGDVFDTCAAYIFNESSVFEVLAASISKIYVNKIFVRLMLLSDNFSIIFYVTTKYSNDCFIK